jgi:RNA polymerase Rpb6
MQSIKEISAGVSAVIEPRSLNDVAKETGNLYKSISIMSKRSNQISMRLKEELLAKLDEFASTTDNLEEIFENREQIEISRFYERMPNPVLLAIKEFNEQQTYYRDPETETEE